MRLDAGSRRHALLIPRIKMGVSQPGRASTESFWQSHKHHQCGGEGEPRSYSILLA